MPPSLRDLLRIRELGLVVRAGEAGLDRPVLWVHASELENPTPFLTGGEFLLTTGRFGDGTDSSLRSYVARLAEADLAGLGFGMGLPHEQMPAALVGAASEVGLPLLEVPLETPFITISRTVAEAIAAEQFAAAKRGYDRHHALTRAALGRGGASAVGRLLARELTAWTLVLDAADALVLTEPPSAARWVSGLADVLDRLRVSRPPASAVVRFGDDEVLLQSLGSGASVRGFLVVGRATGFDEGDRQLVNLAVSLLSVGLEQSHALDLAERRLRSGVFQLLLAGQAAVARPIVRELSGDLPREPIRLVALAGTAASRTAATDLVKSEATRMRELVFHAESDDVTVVATSDGTPFSSWLLTLPARLDGLRLGLSDPTGYEHFSRARRQAVQAAEEGLRSGRTISRFAELRQGGLAQFMDPERAEAFAAALVEPLVRHDQTGRGDLVRSLLVWLKHNGQWDPAAAQLGVHRHTLRQRIRRAEELLDRPIDAAGTRAELWLALQILDGPDS